MHVFRHFFKVKMHIFHEYVVGLPWYDSRMSQFALCGCHDVTALQMECIIPPQFSAFRRPRSQNTILAAISPFPCL